jgi:hypothetical protein
MDIDRIIAHGMAKFAEAVASNPKHPGYITLRETYRPAKSGERVYFCDPVRGNMTLATSEIVEPRR